MAKPVQIIITAFNKTGRALAGVRRGFANTATSIKSNITGIQGAIAGLGLTLGGGLLAKFLLDANVEMQKLKSNLQTFTGTADSASAVFDQLAQFAATTPFELQDSVQAFITLNAAGIKPTEETLTRLGDIASASGRSIVDAADAIRAAATGEFERLKALNITARVDGEKLAVTYQGVTTKIDRNVGSITHFLEELSEDKFAGAMERQMNTLGGAISNLKDNLFQLATATGEQGFSGEVMNALTATNAWLAGIREAPGTFNKVVKISIASVKAIGSTLWNLVTIAFRVGNALGEALGNGFQLLKFAVFSTLDVISDAANAVIEKINTIPGVDIQVNLPNFDEQVDNARRGIADTNRRAAEAVNDIIVDVQQIGEAWLEVGLAAATAADQTERVKTATGLKAEGKGEVIGGDQGETADQRIKRLAEEAKALKERIRVLSEATKIDSTRREAIPKLIALEDELSNALFASGVTLAERVLIEQQLAQVRTALGEATQHSLSAIGTPGEGEGQRGVLAIFEEMTAGARMASDSVRALGSDVDYLAATTLVDFGATWGQAFEQVGEGSLKLGKAILGSSRKAIAGTARAKGQETMLDAAAAAAKGLTNPVELLKAARLFAVGAGYFALSGVLGGGGGGGAAAAGGGGGAASRRDSEQLSSGDGSVAYFVLQGGDSFDMSDPRKAEQFEEALNIMARYGRIEVIRR